MIGALLSYVTDGTLGKYSPMNANLGLLPGEARKGMSKADKKAAQVKLKNTVLQSLLKQAST